MAKPFAAIAGVVVTSFVLALVFWLVSILLAPHVYFFLLRHLWHAPNAPLSLVLLAATAPVLVAIPFGFGFGFLPWRRPMTAALIVGSLAVGLNLAHKVWASAWAGFALLDSRSWVWILEAALLLALFEIAAAVGVRVALERAERQRLIVGTVILSSITAVTFVSVYIWSQLILVSPRAA
jgi:hypothetical protein